jgi:hypothetical protein
LEEKMRRIIAKKDSTELFIMLRFRENTLYVPIIMPNT